MLLFAFKIQSYDDNIPKSFRNQSSPNPELVFNIEIEIIVHNFRPHNENKNKY